MFFILFYFAAVASCKQFKIHESSAPQSHFILLYVILLFFFSLENVYSDGQKRVTAVLMQSTAITFPLHVLIVYYFAFQLEPISRKFVKIDVASWLWWWQAVSFHWKNSFQTIYVATFWFLFPTILLQPFSSNIPCNMLIHSFVAHFIRLNFILSDSRLDSDDNLSANWWTISNSFYGIF